MSGFCYIIAETAFLTLVLPRYSPERLGDVASTILEAATEGEYSGIFLEVCRDSAETR